MVSVRKLCCLAMLLGLGCGVWLAAPLVMAEEQPDIKRGEALFRRDWLKHKAAQAGPIGSDGLGPLFNAVSCVACHSQGGIGGAGNNEHNLQLLSQVKLLGAGHRPAVAHGQRQGQLATHPNLKENLSTVLHRHSTHAAYQERVAHLQQQPVLFVTGMAEKDPLTEIAEQALPEAERTHEFQATLRTERNTPSLFGAGLIDAIELEWLDKIASVQKDKYPELAGEMAPNGGKFGWRGQIATLQEFVQAACANELGLQTEEFPQPMDTLSGVAAPILPQVDEEGNILFVPDMYPAEMEALFRFVEQLPPPAEVRPKTAAERFVWERGKRHFHQIQCGVCHQERIGMVKGIYSDLLLHDMGQELWDPVSLAGDATGAYVQLVRNSLGQPGGFPAMEQRWRTPPLWGVRDSAPYMHDGRAATIEEAILAHSGQAAASKRKFERLIPAARRELIAFVESLGAPPGRNILAMLEKKHRAEMAVSKPHAGEMTQDANDLSVSMPFACSQCAVTAGLFQELSVATMPAETVQFFTSKGVKP